MKLYNHYTYFINGYLLGSSVIKNKLIFLFLFINFLIFNLLVNKLIIINHNICNFIYLFFFIFFLYTFSTKIIQSFYFYNILRKKNILKDKYPYYYGIFINLYFSFILFKLFLILILEQKLFFYNIYQNIILLLLLSFLIIFLLIHCFYLNQKNEYFISYKPFILISNLFFLFILNFILINILNLNYLNLACYITNREELDIKDISVIFKEELKGKNLNLSYDSKKLKGITSLLKKETNNFNEKQFLDTFMLTNFKLVTKFGLLDLKKSQILFDLNFVNELSLPEAFKVSIKESPLSKIYLPLCQESIYLPKSKPVTAALFNNHEFLKILKNYKYTLDKEKLSIDVIFKGEEYDHKMLFNHLLLGNNEVLTELKIKNEKDFITWDGPLSSYLTYKEIGLLAESTGEIQYLIRTGDLSLNKNNLPLTLRSLKTNYSSNTSFNYYLDENSFNFEERTYKLEALTNIGSIISLSLDKEIINKIGLSSYINNIFLKDVIQLKDLFFNPLKEDYNCNSTTENKKFFYFYLFLKDILNIFKTDINIIANLIKIDNFSSYLNNLINTEFFSIFGKYENLCKGLVLKNELSIQNTFNIKLQGSNFHDEIIKDFNLLDQFKNRPYVIWKDELVLIKYENKSKLFKGTSIPLYDKYKIGSSTEYEDKLTITNTKKKIITALQRVEVDSNYLTANIKLKAQLERITE